MISTFSWAILVSACITIALTFNLNKGQTSHQTVYYLFKPLTSFLILTLAYLIMPEGTAKNWILLALVFCLIGDIALMFEGDMPFIAGLLAFLIGHALFIAVFFRMAVRLDITCVVALHGHLCPCDAGLVIAPNR
ncbi:MAG: hypothetical protein IPN04_06570 [Rhodoferax sp.]|nr:hypothetical protein [Rhodoferax sp.]